MSAITNISHVSFGSSSAQADTLTIELSDSLIAFAEFAATENKPLFTCHYPIDKTASLNINEQLIAALKHFQLSAKKYQSVYINYFTPQFTLCPLAFYKAENNRSLLEFNVGNVNNQIVLNDDINHDIKLIYAIDESLKSLLDRLFPQHQLKHSLTVLSKLMLTSDENSRENLLISVQPNHIELVLKKEHQFLLANQYTVKTNEDILYYILFITEQFNFNPLNVAISLSGNIPADSDLVTTLKKYIKNIRFVRGHKNMSWSAISGAPQHFNYTLLNRLFCE